MLLFCLPQISQYHLSWRWMPEQLEQALVFLQEDVEGIVHPICYLFKKFTKHQHNYSTIEKQALALEDFEVDVGATACPVIL